MRGAALVTAMLIVTFVSVLASGMLWSANLDRRRAEIMLFTDQAFEYALGAEAWAADVLREDRAQSEIDYPGEDWALALPPLPIDGGYIEGLVEDMQGFGGEHYTYRLTIREAQPDFAISIAEFDGTVNASSGAAFSLVADRIDDFDGEIRCEITGVPAGWHVTSPLSIQAGHLRAKGTLFALHGAKQPSAEEWKAVKIVARATVGDKGFPMSGWGELCRDRAPREGCRSSARCRPRRYEIHAQARHEAVAGGGNHCVRGPLAAAHEARQRQDG